MNNLKVDDDIELVKYYNNYKTTIKWYQDEKLCYQIDNRYQVYNLDRLKQMYDYLKHHGFLYYIKYKNHLCGDVCLKYDGDLAITINNNYQNKHIGRRVITKIILIAKYLGFKQVQAKIYTFNIQSQKMFLSIGFKKLDTEYYVYSIS